MTWHGAAASPNIALIKYWGKLPGTANLPAVESIAATLGTLRTRQVLRWSAEQAEDSLILDGAPASAAVCRRLSRFADLFRALGNTRLRLQVHSDSNFPVAAGLASSASAFAALAVALDASLDLGLDRQQLASLARQGSGSAARSLLGGLCHLRLCGSPPHDTRVEPLSTPLQLEAVVAVLQDGPKAVGSTAGMTRSRDSSPFYAAWVDSSGADVDAARQALAAGDFAALAAVAEHSCLKMHAVAHTARPPLLYFSPGTWAGIRRVQQLRAQGVPTFFTVDAGPHLVAFCQPDAAPAVRRALGDLPGLLRLLQVGLGAGAAPLSAAGVRAVLRGHRPDAPLHAENP